MNFANSLELEQYSRNSLLKIPVLPQRGDCHMKPAIVTGFLLGLVHSLFNLYAMLTRNPLALTTWNRINGLLYFALVIALITLSATLIRRGRQLDQTIAAIAVAAFLFAALHLLMYTVTTWYFPGHIEQLPFFTNDYLTRGYASPQEYLFTANNYRVLFQSQLFSFGLVILFQIAIGILTALLCKFILPRWLPLAMNNEQ